MHKALMLAILTLLAQAANATPAEKRGELDAALTERAEVIDRELQRKLTELIDSVGVELVRDVAEPTLPHVAKISDPREPLRLADNNTH